MYTPRKGWQRWKKVIASNMSEEDGNIVYRLGQDKWEEHCFEYSRAKNISQEQAGMEFPISSFDYYWAYDIAYGTDYMLHDVFPYLFMKLKEGRTTNDYIYCKTKNRLIGLIDEMTLKSEGKTKKYFEEHPDMKETRTFEELFNDADEDENVW
jgi:hypothetical protein